MNRISLGALLSLLWTAPALAEQMAPSMPGMSMPGASGKAAAPGPTSAARRGGTKAASRRSTEGAAPDRRVRRTRTVHDMSAMPGMSMPQGSKPPDGGGMTGAGMAHGSSGSGRHEPAIPQAPAPPPPRDHAADRYYDPALMADARRELRQENGGGIYSKIFANILEFQPGPGGTGYRWNGQAWFGGDVDRLVLKSQGVGARRGGVEEAELQTLYSRAIGPYTDLQVGVRYDFKPDPSRTYATIGMQTLLPYLLDFESALFVSSKGEVLGRMEGFYDLLLTQRLVLQPRAELNFAAQNSPDIGIGSGLSSVELGLRLRYEVRREFAPYIGVSYDEKLGRTARYARSDGGEAAAVKFVTGIRTWF